MSVAVTPPLDGPLANEADLDHALFGPQEAEDGHDAE